jgi:hypothetical protein
LHRYAQSRESKKAVVQNSLNDCFVPRRRASVELFGCGTATDRFPHGLRSKSKSEN